MKKSIFIFLAISIVLACDKSDDPPILEPVVLKDLPLKIGIDSVPLSLLTTHKKAVFINSLGEEKIMNLEYLAGERAMNLNSLPYQAAYERINYTDPAGPGLWMVIDAQIHYASISLAHEIVLICLSPFSYQDWMSSIHLASEPNGFFNRYFPSITIAGLNFNNVYGDSNETFPEGNSYTEVYYNTALGIVGFQGINGEMWGLRRYE